MNDTIECAVTNAIHTSSRQHVPRKLARHHLFVDDLGFDSMAIVKLSLSLESELGHPVLLDGWVASAGRGGLTVGSLIDYLGKEKDVTSLHG